MKRYAHACHYVNDQEHRTMTVHVWDDFADLESGAVTTPGIDICDHRTEERENRLPQFCNHCGRPIRWSEELEDYVHLVSPESGCWLISGVKPPHEHEWVDTDSESIGAGEWEKLTQKCKVCGVDRVLKVTAEYYPPRKKNSPPTPS